MRIERKAETPGDASKRRFAERTSATWDPVRFMAIRPPARSLDPTPNVFPAVLVWRETADVPASLVSAERDRAMRVVTSQVLGNFWGDIKRIDSSPLLQLLDLAGYNQSAKENRERIARDAAVSRG